MLHRLRGFAPWLMRLFVAFVAAPAFAQVPQDTTFTGTLVDASGAPLVGPVNMQLRIFDAETGGTQLYSERHVNTSLDATGGFSVQLGLGTNPSGSFDAALFSDVNRWLEVVVDAEVLAPRQIIGSVPWALIAQQANDIVPDPNAPRFEDCGDGTVADRDSGLLWEQKTGTPGTSVDCATAGCPDPHDVNNLYEWSSTGGDPDGGAFTDFLARLNGDFNPNGATGCFANHCDWQIPKIAELQTILIGPDAFPGKAPTCPSAPCVDPGFAAMGGPTASSRYWSASTLLGSPLSAWFADFNNGNVTVTIKTAGEHVRAVRTGSCD